MSLKAINLQKTIKYESDLDDAKGTDEATKFIIGAIDSRTFSSIVDKQLESSQGKDGSVTYKPNQLTTAYVLVKFGLKGFEKWKDSDGNDIKFEVERVNMFGKAYSLVKDSILEAFPQELIGELSGAIMDFNNLTEEDAKN